MTDDELKQQWWTLNERRSHLMRIRMYDQQLTMEESAELSTLHELGRRYVEITTGKTIQQIGCLGMAEDAMMEIAEEVLAKYETDETLGMIVRDAWVSWAKRQANPKPEWLDPWEKLPAEIQEVDRLIGIAIKRRVLAVLVVSGAIMKPKEGEG